MTLTPREREAVRARFERYVLRLPFVECWLWGGATNRWGYGHLSVGGRQGQTIKAHRLAWEFYVGPCPTGLVPDHLCRQRNCVRPDHLEWVTQRENLRRGAGVVGLNARKTHCPSGHAYTPANNCRWSAARGERKCKACHAARERASRRQRRLTRARA